MNTGNISFSEKKVSKNAVLTLVMGIGILIGFAILTVLSIVTEGRLNVVGGSAWMYFCCTGILLCPLGRDEL